MGIGINIQRKTTKVVFDREKIIDLPPILNKEDLGLLFKKIKEKGQDRVVMTHPFYTNIEEKSNLISLGSCFISFFLISEPLAGIIGANSNSREKPTVYFDISREKTTIIVAKIGSDEKGRPNLIILNKEPIHNIGEIDIDYAILEYIMDRNRKMREIFLSVSKDDRQRLISCITKASWDLFANLSGRIEWRTDDFSLDITITQNEFEGILAPIVEIIKEKLTGELKACDATRVVISACRINKIKAFVSSLFKECIEDPSVIAYGASLYSEIDYKRVESPQEKKEEAIDCSYGFFYDRFVPFIHKGDLFGGDGIIRRESHIGFNRPGGQLPLIKEIPPFYQLLGLFPFFLPAREQWSLSITLELFKDEIRLTGRHPAIGEVIYPHIRLVGNGKERERGLLAEIQSQMFPSQELYGSIDALGVIKEAIKIQEEIEAKKRIPVIKEQGFRLASALDKARNDIFYSRSLLGKKAEDSACFLLNKLSETLFLLLRYNLIDDEEYRKRLAGLYKMYF